VLVTHYIFIQSKEGNKKHIQNFGAEKSWKMTISKTEIEKG